MSLSEYSDLAGDLSFSQINLHFVLMIRVMYFIEGSMKNKNKNCKALKLSYVIVLMSEAEMVFYNVCILNNIWVTGYIHFWVFFHLIFYLEYFYMLLNIF